MASIVRVVAQVGASGGDVTRSLGAVSAGNCLVAFVFGYNEPPATDTIEDSVNGSWGAPILSFSSTLNPDDRVACFVKKNSGAGTPTLTMHIPSSRYYMCCPYVLDADPNCYIQASTIADDFGTDADTTSITPRWGYSAVAIAGLTHNSGNPDFTPDAGWTLGEFMRDWSSAPYQPGACQHRTYSSTSALSAGMTLTAAVQWLFGMVLVEDPPPVYRVQGGGNPAKPKGYFGHEGEGGADHIATIVFNPPLKAGMGVVIPISNFQRNTLAADITDDGGNTWTRDAHDTFNSNSGDGVGASISTISSVLTSDLTTITYADGGSGDAGGYGQLGAYVVNKPDTVNGFFGGASTNSQKTVSSVTPGTVTPPTNLGFFIFCGNNRGHTEDLKPYTKPSGYTDAALNHSEIDADGAESAVHNSTTQSGWWFGKAHSSYTAETPTFGFSAVTGEARSIIAVYNILGGVVDPGGGEGSYSTVFDSKVFSSGIFRG
jgi:hypothetical protein